MALKGKLLVASPPLVDDNFDRTVVLLLEHSGDGALGVVLNRPGDTELPEPLESWSRWLTAPQVVFGGGPVEPDAVIGLARSPSGPTEHWVPVLGPIGTVDLSADPDDVPPLDALRIFRGYAGWGAEQLEGELASGAWIVADAEPGDAFTDEPLLLWRSVLRRQGGRIAWLANFPDDVSAN